MEPSTTAAMSDDKPLPVYALGTVVGTKALKKPGKRTVKRLLAVGAVSLSCLWLSLVPMGEGWAQTSRDADISTYIQKLKDKDATVRYFAAGALGRMGGEAKAAIPALITALQSDKDATVRYSAASALGSMRGETKAAIPALMTALQSDKDKDVRSNAAGALMSMGGEAKAAIPALMTALQSDKDKDVRSNAAGALMSMGGEAKAAIPALMTALQSDKDKDVRSNAAGALMSMRGEAKAAIPALITALQSDKDKDVRSFAAGALGNMGGEAKAAIPALITALQSDKNATVRSFATYALMSMGGEAKAAIPALMTALQSDKDENVRSNTAGALMSMGGEAKAAIPALIMALQSDKDKDVRSSAAGALGKIGESFQDKAGIMPFAELDKAIADLEKALKALKDRKDKKLDISIASVTRSLDALKTKRQSRLLDRTLEWMTKHPWVTGGLIYIIFFPSLWLILLRVRPLWILHVNNALKPLASFKLPDALGGLTFPIRTLLFIEFFNYHPRVLDAWVEKRLNSAKQGFNKKKTVTERSIYVPIPVVLDNNNLAQLTGTDLQPIFNQKRATLLIWGEGGAGKTSLACTLAQWAMSDDETQRLSKHRMLPVLIEQELDHPLKETIGGQLQALISEAQAIDNDLLTNLLRQRRILVIVDHFSEMSEATRNKIHPAETDFPVNALIVTSRLEEKLDEVPKTTIQPLRVAGDKLSSFMEAYLTQRRKRDLFTDVEYFDACRRLSLMVGQRNITVLLAKLYAEQMIATKEGTAIDLPENIPDLMLAYLNELNRDRLATEPNNRTVQSDAKVIAWQCLKTTFRPTSAKLEDILVALDDSDTAPERLQFLEKRLRLIQTIGAAQDKVRLALDPLAEYLAGLYLIDTYGADTAFWQDFLSQANAIPDVELIKGFLLAVRDCCLAKGKEAGVPDFVADELALKTGLTTPEPAVLIGNTSTSLSTSS
ncbi:HEAT repeat domain-containing protein [Calothrix sp. PCC 7507]|uniref:HEAT repeat domain-containing protein n=1 Tax=Calothrix sp. PCC 7507 TaxID=99598 RepID=UPI00029ED0C8|nr:HEAT repeat domain-containing protein [Calothrix sp. PCC 7507]AFY32265.1 PBS lyase HEAT domain protein repeat-containing protein [Calothrix sp. PCC 7507]